MTHIDWESWCHRAEDRLRRAVTLLCELQPSPP